MYGAYASVHFGGNASLGPAGGAAGIYCAGFVASLSFLGSISSCNPDYNIAQAGIITRWTPVKNLTFSADVTFSHLDQKMTGFVAYPGSSASGKPAAFYELKDQNNALLLLRAQRNW